MPVVVRFSYQDAQSQRKTYWGKMTFPHQQAALRIPHARTLRKALEQVKSMVTDGASPPYQKIPCSMDPVVEPNSRRLEQNEAHTVVL